MPLTDITNIHDDTTVRGGQCPGSRPCAVKQAPPLAYRRNPYGWQCLIEETPSEVFMESELRAQARRDAAAAATSGASAARPGAQLQNPSLHALADGDRTDCVSPPSTEHARTVLVEFKCHVDEYECCSDVDAGQYVMVSGDRGIDVGVVTRVRDRTTASARIVEKTWPSREVLRRATQKEVDFWALDLKEMEENALAICQKMVHRMDMPMEVVQAEYQFDCKKLTFHYIAQSRIEFVQLLKDLYREFGCRIWMEKVRARDV